MIGLFLVTSVTAAVLLQDFEREGGSMAAVINVLALPLYLRDVVFLGHIDPDSPLGGVEHGAWVALGVYVVILVTFATILLRRYRWVER